MNKNAICGNSTHKIVGNIYNFNILTLPLCDSLRQRRKRRTEIKKKKRCEDAHHSHHIRVTYFIWFIFR